MFWKCKACHLKKLPRIEFRASPLRVSVFSVRLEKLARRTGAALLALPPIPPSPVPYVPQMPGRPPVLLGQGSSPRPSVAGKAQTQCPTAPPFYVSLRWKALETTPQSFFVCLPFGMLKSDCPASNLSSGQPKNRVRGGLQPLLIDVNY